MAITIGTSLFPTLTAQPYGYDESNTTAGLTARRWVVSGLLTPNQWLSLLSVYDAWRNLRIQDPDSKVSGTVGTTVNLSGDGPGDQSWTNVACWFKSAPQAEQSGAYLSATVELIDANQALQVLQRGEELSESASEDLPDFGTVTLGETVLKLVRPMEAYGAGPSLELTASGGHYVTGPLVAVKTRDIEGTTNLAGWTAIRSWYESQVSAVPLATSWFPISAPSVTARNKIVSGVKTVEYTVSIQLGQVM